MKRPLDARPGLLMAGIGALFLVAVVATFALRGPTRLSTEPDWTPPEGDPANGEAAIREYGCGSCHSIPGIQNADSRVGPRLDGFVEQSFIAGKLANTPENLARWIHNPQDVTPGTAMPNLGVSETEARDIAAYIYTATREQTTEDPD